MSGPISPRDLLRSGAAACGSLILAPMLNLSRYRLFAHSPAEYSARTIRRVRESLVIDMLSPLTLNFPPKPSRMSPRHSAAVLFLLASSLAGSRAAGQAAADPLEARVRARLDSLDAITSLYAEHLPTGRKIEIRADRPMNALSVIKIPIMVLAYRDAEAGRLDLDARYRIRPEDLRRGSGLLQTFVPGLEPTWGDLVEQMIVTSDNTATDILIHRLGLGRVNALLDSLGYRETRLRATTGDLFRGVWEQADPEHAALTDLEVYQRGFPSDSLAARRTFAFEGDSTRWLGRTTAREMSRLLAQIHAGELASREHSDEMIGILRRQFYASRLPQRIRFRASVAHKTGDWPPYAGNDVGIIHAASGPIVVSAFTNQNRGDFFELEATLGRIAEDLLDTWGNTDPGGRLGRRAANAPRAGGPGPATGTGCRGAEGAVAGDPQPSASRPSRCRGDKSSSSRRTARAPAR